LMAGNGQVTIWDSERQDKGSRAAGVMSGAGSARRYFIGG
jgi:hypothetical protein